jgi:hypothetical protein
MSTHTRRLVKASALNPNIVTYIKSAALENVPQHQSDIRGEIEKTLDGIFIDRDPMKKLRREIDKVTEHKPVSNNEAISWNYTLAAYHAAAAEIGQAQQDKKSR